MNGIFFLLAAVLLLPACCTTVGAAGVFLMRPTQEPKTRRMLCGMAAGIMLAASVWSLLLPAIQRAEEGLLPAWLPPTAGLVIGAVGLLRLEEAAGRLMHTGSKEHGLMGRGVLAVTLHNLPEGMVVGLAAARALRGEPDAISGALALALGIGLQNIPEGAAVSLPLVQAGQGRRKAFCAGAASGLVEPLGALLALARGADLTENLTTLAKTGLCALTEEEVCALENYAYTWSPNAAAWRAAFRNDPKGFGDRELTEEDSWNLSDAEKARALLVNAADALRGKVRNANAEAISRALYFCLKELGAEEQQAAQVEAIRAARGIPAAEEAAREWNVVMELLDEMARLLGEQTVTVAEYEDLFGLLLRSSDLGHIPQTLDAVVLASAGKMRLDAPDYVFELGLAEG